MKRTKLLLFFALLTVSSLQAQWLHQDSGVNVALNDVHCITEDIVLAVGGTGTILKTTDGGENWTQKVSNTTEHLNKLDFANNTIGYIVGENGILLKTIDAGETWTVVDVDETVELYAVSCVNENIVYIAGENGLIKKTDNGGTTWTTQDSGITMPVYNIQFVSETIGFSTAGGYSDLMYFLKTIDSGITWITESIGGGATPSLSFYDEEIGYISGSFVWKTTDGGNNWENTWGNEELSFSIDAILPNILWTTGFNLFEYTGYIFKGDFELPPDDVWTYVLVELEYYMSIDFANENTGYVVGFNDNDGTGLIKKNSTGFNILSHDEQPLQDTLTIQPNPNPVKDVLNISFSKNVPNKTFLCISNATGSCVLQKQLISEEVFTLDVSFLPTGVYFIKIEKEGKILTKKIVKL